MSAENKELVRRLFEEAFFNGRLEVLDEIIAVDYIQHNPHVPPGREGLRQFIAAVRAKLAAAGPLPVARIEQIISEGDTVAVRLNINGAYVLDMFRVANGVLQEHWDTTAPPVA